MKTVQAGAFGFGKEMVVMSARLDDPRSAWEQVFGKAKEELELAHQWIGAANQVLRAMPQGEPLTLEDGFDPGSVDPFLFKGCRIQVLDRVTPQNLEQILDAVRQRLADLAARIDRLPPFPTLPR